jgi:hypothetical protein
MRNDTTDWMVVDCLGLKDPVHNLQYSEACDLAQEWNARANPLLDSEGQPVDRYIVKLDTDKIKSEIVKERD